MNMVNAQDNEGCQSMMINENSGICYLTNIF